MDTEDVLQEGFLKIYSKIDTFTQGNSLKAWMSVIIQRTSLTHFVANKKYQNYEMLEGFEPMQKIVTSFIDQLIAKDTYKKAMNILHLKSSNQYMYARLYLEECMGIREISKDIDVPEGTVKSQVSRARSSLRSLINKLDSVN
jgi:RNA polymerase sigma-70 factor (ECF subfamily)